MEDHINQRLNALVERLAADPNTATLAEELRQVATDIQARETQSPGENGGDLLAQAGRLIELGTMAAAVFHEMNQPLLGIKGFAELLQEAIGSDQHEKMAAWAQEIRKQVDRVQQMQRQVADFLRPDTRPGTLVKLDAALDEALVLFRGRLAKKKIQLGTSVPADLPGLAIRKQHLVQILVNLLSNAFDALVQHDQRVLRVAAQARADAVRVLVTDTGPGVALETRDKLFEPFYTEKGEAGTGLGLYISRRLAEQYGGSLDLVDPASLGWQEPPATAFELVVPVAKDKKAD